MSSVGSLPVLCLEKARLKSDRFDEIAVDIEGSMLVATSTNRLLSNRRGQPDGMVGGLAGSQTSKKLWWSLPAPPPFAQRATALQVKHRVEQLCV